jgi:hypothetical protein
MHDSDDAIAAFLETSGEWLKELSLNNVKKVIYSHISVSLSLSVCVSVSVSLSHTHARQPNAHAHTWAPSQRYLKIDHTVHIWLA